MLDTIRYFLATALITIATFLKPPDAIAPKNPIITPTITNAPSPTFTNTPTPPIPTIIPQEKSDSGTGDDLPTSNEIIKWILQEKIKEVID